MRTAPQPHEIISLLELTHESLPKFTGNFESDVELFEKFKELCKKQRNKLALKYHPDINPGCNRLAEINDLIDRLMETRLQPPQPVVSIVLNGMMFTQTTSASCGNTVTFNSIFRR